MSTKTTKGGKQFFKTPNKKNILTTVTVIIWNYSKLLPNKITRGNIQMIFDIWPLPKSLMH